MIDFRAYLTELFEKPLTLDRIKQRETLVSYFYKIDPQLEPKNRDESRDNTLTVNFELIGREVDRTDWQLDFVRGGSTAITDKGDAGRVFATVISAVQDFITKHKPDSISFTAAKEEYRPNARSYSKGSRIRLYSSLIKRFAPKMGYALVDNKDRDGAYYANHPALFTLERIKP